MNPNDKNLRSFIDIEETSDFPIQNLPYGVFNLKEGDKRVGVAIGQFVLDLAALFDSGFLDDLNLGDENIFASNSLNKFMAMGKIIWKKTRERISFLLLKNTPDLQSHEALYTKYLFKQSEVEMHLPIQVSEFTDFYASYHHAFNVGSLVRGPENALMPNWKHLPVGYHGRSSSVVLSGTNIYRPNGQLKGPNDEVPRFGPSERLDFELEVGTVVGIGNQLGEPIRVSKASDHLFGLLLVNDWSARDIQFWEYRPLGPFLGKNFATSISPWVVTTDALQPFMVDAMTQDVEVLPYLKEASRKIYDIRLKVSIKSEKMEKYQTITKSNFKYLYWTNAQQIAHHTITGCNMRTGDIFASGTISGPNKDARGCMLEITWRGQEPLKLDSDEERLYLEDGDTIKMEGYAKGEGYRIGFGEVTTQILPAKQV